MCSSKPKSEKENYWTNSNSLFIKWKQNLHLCALKNIKALCKAFAYASGGIGAGFFFGMDFTIMIGRPMTINATTIDQNIHQNNFLLHTTHPKSMYLSFFLLSCGPNSQLAWVSSSCRDNAPLSTSMLRLWSSSASCPPSLFISNEPPQWFAEYILGDA